MANNIKKKNLLGVVRIISMFFIPISNLSYAFSIIVERTSSYTNKKDLKKEKLIFIFYNTEKS